ncbi:MAG: glycosyltransferase family 2 protein [Clostridia bacterium]
MEQDKIDILMATYNGEKYLGEQIDSILGQTYQNFRLLISDDGSTDGTMDILAKYAKQDDRIVIYRQEKNLGYVKNFAFLLTKVESNYYMLSDQDDVWLKEKVEKSIETLKNKKVDLVYGDLEVVDKDLKTIYPSFNDYMKLTRKIEKCHDYKVQYLYNTVTGCTLLSKKEFLDKILPIPTISNYMIHDYWIALMVSVYGKTYCMKERYIKYRQHGHNQVGTDKISHGYTHLEQVRKLFIEVKLGVFGSYVSENEKFPKPIQELNQKALSYYQMLSNKKYFNFKGWGIFHELYKNETVSYYIQNFVIMNLPALGTVLFRIRYQILKWMGKR